MHKMVGHWVSIEFGVNRMVENVVSHRLGDGGMVGQLD